jgi:hypothetical protein
MDITRRVKETISAPSDISGLQTGFSYVLVISNTLRCLASLRVDVGVGGRFELGLGIRLPW